nr:uncharacterized protein LOC110552226 [Meriones unguiculatus]
MTHPVLRVKVTSLSFLLRKNVLCDYVSLTPPILGLESGALTCSSEPAEALSCEATAEEDRKRSAAFPLSVPAGSAGHPSPYQANVPTIPLPGAGVPLCPCQLMGEALLLQLHTCTSLPLLSSLSINSIPALNCLPLPSFWRASSAFPLSWTLTHSQGHLVLFTRSQSHQEEQQDMEMAECVMSLMTRTLLGTILTNLFPKKILVGKNPSVHTGSSLLLGNCSIAQKFSTHYCLSS